MASVNDAIQLLLSSSRCTLPREKGNGSLGGYGPRGRVRVSTRSRSLVPVPVVPSLGRRATGACLGMAWVNRECQRRDPVARPVPVVPSLGRRATGASVGMVQGEG